ncbi:MAG: glycosyltransferase family 39 protein [Lentimicrobium sp.]
MKSNRFPNPWLLLISFSAVALHLAFAVTLGYQRDEMLYFTLGNHPAMGYATVPPFTGWVAWLVQNTVGTGLFAVRLIPAWLSGVMVFLMADMARLMKGNPSSQLLAAISGLGTVLFLRAFYLFQPVAFDIFFWTISSWLLLKYIKNPNPSTLMWTGFILGMGFLNKYLILLWLFSLLVSLSISSYRKIIFSRPFIITGIIAFLVALPNLVWQVVNNLPVINHMKELNESQLVNVDRLNFLTDQLLMVWPATFFVIPGLIVLLFGKHFREYRFLGYSALLVILILMLLRGKAYYSAGVMPLLISAGCVWADSILKSKPVFVFILASVFLFLSAISLPIGIPVYKEDKLVKYFDNVADFMGSDAIRRDEDGNYQKLPQDYADMLGWDELAVITAKAWKSIPEKETAFIYADNYGQAAAVSLIGRKLHLPEAVSFSESFRYWYPDKFKREITHLVYINDEEPGRDVKEIFSEIILAGRIENQNAREYGTGVYVCSGPVTSFNDFWKERTKGMR